MDQFNEKSIFVSATDTDVGKTFISAGLVYTLLSLGYKTAYFKPVQSGASCYEASDMQFVDSICKGEKGYSSHNCYMLSEPVSPHLAAEIDGVIIEESEMLKKYEELMLENDFVVVEGAGGLAVPIKRDGLWIYDLINKLDISTIIVSNMRVGAINQTLSSVAFAKAKKIKVSGIVLNNSEKSDVHLDNVSVLRDAIKLIDSNSINSVYTCNEVKNTDDIKRYYLEENFKNSILKMLK